MVFPTEKYNLREASCCKVEVVKGAAGVFLAGFVSKSAILKLAPTLVSRKAFASSFDLKLLLILALKVLAGQALILIILIFYRIILETDFQCLF